MTIGALVAIHGSAMFWGWPFKRFFWLQCAVFYPFAAWGIWVAFGIPLARCLGLFAMGIAGGTLFFYVGGRRLSGPYK